MLGKVQTLELRDGLGVATYNSSTSKIDFPPGVPKSRLPGTRPPKTKTPKKALVFRVGATVPALLSDSSGSAGESYSRRVQVVSDAVALHNRIPQEALGGASPHDLIYGHGLSFLTSSSDCCYFCISGSQFSS